MNTIQSLNLPLTYFLWHYSLAWEDLFRLYRNFSWFLWNFFSISLLLETLIAPWHRRKEHPDKDTAGILGSFILNSILRLVGFAIRFIAILSGLAALAFFSLLFAVFVVLWPFLPIIAAGCLVSGVVWLLAL